MSAETRTLFAERRELVAAYGPGTLKASDFMLGAAAGIAAGVLDGFYKAVQDQMTVILLAELATGVALLAVVLAALTIIVGLLDRSYLQVLEAAGGVRDALAPFAITAGTSALTTVVAGLAAVATLVGPRVLGAVALGLATWLAVWSVWGTFLIAKDVVFHGTQRARLLSDRFAAEDRGTALRQKATH